MTIRANSLRNVFSESVSLTVLMTLATVATSTISQSAEPVVDDRAIADRQTDDHVDSRQNTDDNVPSGVPEESPEAKREAIILGMTLFERASGDIRVIDVAAKSPAWDAGVRPGDRIRSLDGVKPERLSDWIDDMGKILQARQDGHAVSTNVERDGETLDLRIKLPVSRADALREARRESMAIAHARARQQQGQLQGQTRQQPMADGTQERTADLRRGSGGLGGFGVFVDDRSDVPSDDGDDRLATSAVARLMAVNTLGDVSGNLQSTGGQIGIAEFQNVGEGVNAVVMVRGLPQGTFRVGIGEGIAAGSEVTTRGSDATDQNIRDVVPVFDDFTDEFENGDRIRNRIRSNANRRNSDFNSQRRDQFRNAMQNQQQLGFVPRPGETSNMPLGSTPRNMRIGMTPNMRIGTTPIPNTPLGTTPTPNAPLGTTPTPNMPLGTTPTPNMPLGTTPNVGGAPVGTDGAPAGTGGTPSGAGDAGGAGAGDGASLADPRHAFLAQQLDTRQQPQGTTSPRGTTPSPNTQQQSGAINGPSNASRATEPATHDPRGFAETQRQPQDDGLPANSPLGSPFVAEIGTLQVGPDGTARVENRFEGITVRQLAGMSVIVESNNWQGQGSLQPGSGRAPSAQGGQAVRENQRRQIQAELQRRQTGLPYGQLNGQMGRGGQGIVAIGVIQLRDGNTVGATGKQTAVQTQQSFDGATQRQRNRRQIPTSRQ